MANDIHSNLINDAVSVGLSSRAMLFYNKRLLGYLVAEKPNMLAVRPACLYTTIL